MTEDDSRKALNKDNELFKHYWIGQIDKENIIEIGKDDAFELIKKNGILYYKEISKK